MKFFRNCAMTASLVCAASSAQGQQYYPYAAPATLPAPAAGARQMWYEDTAPSALKPSPDLGSQASPEQVNAPADGNYAPDYQGAMTGDCADGSCNGDSCGEFGCGMDGFGMWTGPNPCCGPKWYGSLAGLYMTRNKPNPYQMSFDTTNPTGQLILNTDTAGQWVGGGELRVGRYIGCASAVEFSAWALGNMDDTANAYDPAGVGSLNTPFDFRSLAFDVNGTLVPVTDYYDNAAAHTFTRTNEFQNLELNFINWPCAGNPCSRFQFSWLAGLRYFHFREGFLFGTSQNDPTFGVDPAGEAYLDIDVNNQLFGVQIGGKGEAFVTRGLSFYAAPKVGVYNNHMSQRTQIYTGDGLSALNSSSNSNAISLMTQIDVGANYAFNSNISVFAGYRVMAISGIALSDAQIPYLQDDVFGYSQIDHNSNLVLHGVMAGVQLRY